MRVRTILSTDERDVKHPVRTFIIILLSSPSVKCRTILGRYEEQTPTAMYHRAGNKKSPLACDFVDQSYEYIDLSTPAITGLSMRKIGENVKSK